MDLHHKFSSFKRSVLEGLHKVLDQQMRSEADAENEEAESLEAESRSPKAPIRFSAEDSLAASPSLPPSVPPIHSFFLSPLTILFLISSLS